MTVTPLVVLGGGEHGRVVVEAALGRPDAFSTVSITDPEIPAGPTSLAGVASLGDDDALAACLADPSARNDARPALVLGLGLPGRAAVRRRLQERFSTERWAVVVHAWAHVAPSATLEPGVIVLAGAVVGTGAMIGRHSILNSGAIVEHDVRIGENTHVAPGVVIGGGAQVGSGVVIGLGARIRDHVTVGDGATIAMGAVVVGDVAAGTTVFGVPARE